MTFSTKPHRPIDAVAPYWAGEAAVLASYWPWEKRTRATGLAWLERQCFKEIWGSGLDDALAGRCEPLRFDYERAKLAA